MTFQQKLDAVVSKNNSLLCVGLDPEFPKIPEQFQKEKHPQFSFNKYIIDQTHDFVCCYKPNSAFYEARGAVGVAELKMTCDYIHQRYPDSPILLDFKRGDIGNTNESYAQFAFEYLQVDAITLQPYQGGEALSLFFSRKEKGIFILCKTSNPGSGEFQNKNVQSGRDVPSERLYELVARSVVSNWNKNNNCFLVVGATYPEELAMVRKLVGDMTILVPGVGAQEGELEKSLRAGLNSKKMGMIINVSRGIIFAQNPGVAARLLRDEINTIRKYIASQ